MLVGTAGGAVAGHRPGYPGRVTALAAPQPAPHPHPGLFISFEGGDGVGKTTQITVLAGLLDAAGADHLVTREPGGTGLGREIRRLLLHSGEVSPRAEALLYAADRAHHVETRVRPALVRGAIVLTDRYLDSSVAYQGAARALGTREVRDLSLWATGGLLPDLTILLDADPSIAARRTADRGAKDRLECEAGAFHTVLREQFLLLADAEPRRFVVINADQDRDQVADEVARALPPAIEARSARYREAGGRGALTPLERAAARIAARLSERGRL